MIRPAERSIRFKELEEKIQKWWEENGIYEKCKEHSRGGKRYYFLDGPPYASGAIHLGTAWNKILKDVVVRYLTMKGLNVRKQAGWDCHGLPIELKVEEKLGIKRKQEIEDLGVDKFIEECDRWAHEHIEVMTKQFARLGVWMDWDAPYLTLKNEYIEAAWWTIKKAHEKGLLTRDLRVVTWCPRCETALAEAEIEYKDRVDPSIYVKFPVVDKDEYILIWTTTPWTLIGNLAIMVHPEFEYVKAKTKEGVLILAKALVDVLDKELGLEYEILDVMAGKELEGMKYENPLKGVIDLPPTKNAYSVILADFVSLEEGTGCVHSAPGHGPEDFEACEPYGIAPICPVDERGVFTEEAGRFSGLTVKKDDKAILKELEDRRVLLRFAEISHRYGHCWRCKTPIIYRATEQWFIKVSGLKKKMLEEVERVDWVPKWAGSARFRDWIENVRDWTISRQRYWGIPLPIWVCERCGSMEVIGSRNELVERGFEVEDMHKPSVDKIVLKCKCGGEERRVPDVLDVWFDSGVAAWASLGYPERDDEFKEWYPTDFITEGHDQTRGWFYSQLGCGLMAFDEVPYRRVLMHGFTLDEKGNKMSKSLGNVVQPEEVIEKFGAEILRFYVLWANKPWDDLRFNWNEVGVINRMFNIFWNVYVFATTYMSLDRFEPGGVDPGIVEHYKPEDRWIISRLNSLVKEVTGTFDSLHLYRAPRAIHDFILEDLSRWYIPLIRPRTWLENDALEKVTSYHVLYRVLTALATILAPISPHVSEEMYQNLSANFVGEESVHMRRWIATDEDLIDLQLEREMEIVRRLIDAVTSAREKRGIKRRWPVSGIIFHPKDDTSKRAAENLEETIKKQANTHRISILHPSESFREVTIRVEPEMSTIGPEFKKDAGAIIELIRALDGRELEKKISDGYAIDVEGKKVTLYPRHLKFAEEVPERYSIAEFDFGRVYVDSERTDQILSEGYAREIVRRIQEMRKELNLNVEAFIEALVEVKDSDVVKLLNTQLDYISRETRAKTLEISEKVKHRGYEREWEIEGERFVISVREL